MNTPINVFTIRWTDNPSPPLMPYMQMSVCRRSKVTELPHWPSYANTIDDSQFTLVFFCIRKLKERLKIENYEE